MEKNAISLEKGIESNKHSANQVICKCNTCGEEFKAPLSATSYSNSFSKKYYACPRCLSKVADLKQPQDMEVDKGEENETSKIEDAIKESVTCAHQFGYLKCRPKNTPIPEDCLICSKMIDCMSK